MKMKINYHCRANTVEERNQFMDHWRGTDGLEWACPRNWITVVLSDDTIEYWI